MFTILPICFLLAFFGLFNFLALHYPSQMATMRSFLYRLRRYPQSILLRTRVIFITPFAGKTLSKLYVIFKALEVCSDLSLYFHPLIKPFQPRLASVSALSLAKIFLYLFSRSTLESLFHMLCARDYADLLPNFAF